MAEKEARIFATEEGINLFASLLLFTGAMCPKCAAPFYRLC